jgi:uncharacterized membrane protein YfcA
MEFNILLLILTILFFSSLVRSTFGFGDALVAMPLLALFIDIKTATPVVAIIALIIAAYIFVGSKNEIKFSEIKKIIIPTLLGIPIGVIYLKNVDEVFIKLVLAFLLIIFGLFKLISVKSFKAINPNYAYLFGLVSGLLGGAYNTNGPPLIIFGSLRNWSASTFRATLQGIFLPVNFFIVLNHGIGGLWNNNVLKILLYALPVVVFATLLGGYIHKKIPTEKFNKYIYIMLILIGIILINSTL